MNNTLKTLWQEWNNAILEKIGPENQYYNRIEGISESDINGYAKLEDDISIPEELIELYKIHNIKYAAVTSAFSFTLNGAWYKLIPFKNIKEEWEGIQDMNWEDDLEDGSLDKYSPKVNANDFANPRWIPFADGDQGDYLLFDTDPSEQGTYGQIVELINDTWERNVVAESLQELLKNQIVLTQKGEPKDFWDFILGKNNDEIEENESELKEDLVDFIKQEVSKGLYSENEIYEKIEEDFDIEDEDAIHKEIKKCLKKVQKLENEGKNKDVIQLKKAIKILEEEHKIISPDDIGYTQDEAIELAQEKLQASNTSSYVYFTEQDIERCLDEPYNFAIGFSSLEAAKKTEITFQNCGFETQWNGTIEERIMIKNFLWCTSNFENAGNNQAIEVHIPTPKVFKFKDVKPLFPQDIVVWLWEESEPGSNDERDILLLDSDVAIENLDLDHPEKCFGLEKMDEIFAIIITGNLTAKNIFNENTDGSTFLIVHGHLSAENIVIGGQELYVSGDLAVKDLFWGNYNHGSTFIKGAVSGRLFLITEQYDFQYDNKNQNNQIEHFYDEESEDYELDDDTERMVELAGEFFEEELLFYKIDTIEDEDYEDITFWTDVVNRYSVIEFLDENKNVLLAQFDYGVEKKSIIKEEDYSEVPTLFPNKNFTTKEDLKTQTENYLKVFEIYHQGEKYYDEAELDLQKIGVKIFVSKPHKRASDGKDVDQSIYFLMDNGAEIIVWVPKKNALSKLFSSDKSIEVLYKNINKNVFQYRSIFDIPNAEQEIFSFNFAWQEILKTIERSQFYYQNLKNIATVERIKNIINLPVVQEKYNDYHDADKFPWLGKYSFAFDWAEENYVTVRISEEIESTLNFDCLHFYFDGFHDNHIRVRYNSSQTNATKDFYSESGTAIRFLDYNLYQKAAKFFTESEKLIQENNEDFLEDKIEETANYFEYYQKNPIKNKLEINFENLNLIRAYCMTQDNTYTYDYFVIVGKYHWINVKWKSHKSKNPENGKVNVSLEILDEPFGNEFSENENYVGITYKIDVDTDNTIKIWSSCPDENTENYIKFFLYELIKEIQIRNFDFVFPYDKQVIKRLLETKILENQNTKNVFDNDFVKMKLQNIGTDGQFWNCGFWAINYFFSFQIWEENNLDVRIAWTHPTKPQLENKSNNMQVVTLRYQKTQKNITYFFQASLEDGEVAIENYDFDIETLQKVFIGYIQMLYYIKIESQKLADNEKEIQKIAEQKANYKPKKPFETIEIEGILFTLYDRKEAAELLQICTDFDGYEIYDTFDMAFEGDIEDVCKSFFLVAENEVVAEKLYLDTSKNEVEDDLYILGYIFTKKVKIEKYVEAYDMDFSMPLICLDDAEIGSLLLCGTTHYFHKNLISNNIQGEYNHGELIVKGATEANLIVVDDFSMKFNDLSAIATISDADRNIMVYNDLSNLDDLKSELNYFPPTHAMQNCIKDDYIFLDTEHKEYKFLGGFWDSKRELPDGKDNFYELLRKNEYLIDDEKLDKFFTVFVTKGFDIIKDLFTNNPKLQNLPVGNLHYEYPNPNYDHMSYYFHNTEDFYILGYWNTSYHFSVSVCFSKLGKKENHVINLFYWNEQNTEMLYSYSSEIDEITLYRNLGQKVFFEAIEMILL